MRLKIYITIIKVVYSLFVFVKYIIRSMIDGKLNISLVHNEADFEAMKQIRRAVFVDEGHIPEDKEFDGNDYCASHVLAKVNGKPQGTMRIRFFSDFVKFERMAVMPDYRKTDMADKIMKYGFDYAIAKGYERVYGICKEELLHRWEKNGYTRIPDAPLIEQNGMRLIPIMRRLPKNEHSLSLQSNLSLLNLPEGEWPQMDALRLREDNEKAYLHFILQKFKKKRD